VRASRRDVYRRKKKTDDLLSKIATSSGQRRGGLIAKLEHDPEKVETGFPKKIMLKQ